MIQAWIFDLDGTLVQTERLKAQSYAKAVAELCPREVSEEQVIEAFKQVVGKSRKEVAEYLISRFDLADSIKSLSGEFGAQQIWQIFVQLRLRLYEELTRDPEVLRTNQWPHNVDLLNEAHEAGCKTALVTMSTCEQANRVLNVLDLLDRFDFVATRDDVGHGKPDPEIYHLALEALSVPASECLAIEDSPAGVRAGLAAGVNVIAVATPFTRDLLYKEKLLPDELIVDEPDSLPGTIRRFMDQHQFVHHSGDDAP